MGSKCWAGTSDVTRDVFRRVLYSGRSVDSADIAIPGLEIGNFCRYLRFNITEGKLVEAKKCPTDIDGFAGYSTMSGEKYLPASGQ